TDAEIEIIRRAPKAIFDDIIWKDSSPSGHSERRWAAQVGVYPLQPVPFNVQSNMEMFLAVNRAGEQCFYYRVVATRQIVRMYHNSPGHLEDGTHTRDQHKHRFTENMKRGGYVPDPLLPKKLRDAVFGFLAEEGIEFRGSRYVPFAITTTMLTFRGGGDNEL